MKTYKKFLKEEIEIPKKVKAGILRAWKGKRLQGGWFLIHDESAINWLEKNIKFGCGSDGCKEIDMGFGYITKILNTGQFKVKA